LIYHFDASSPIVPEIIFSDRPSFLRGVTQFASVAFFLSDGGVRGTDCKFYVLKHHQTLLIDTLLLSMMDDDRFVDMTDYRSASITRIKRLLH
jgi:hypothetical protein